jgi:hypothetical protein
MREQPLELAKLVSENSLGWPPLALLELEQKAKHQ